MATTKTPVMGLNKPAKGDFDWDVPLNENWDKLDKLGAGQLPLLTPLLLDRKLEGDEALGWALQGSVLDGDTYLSVWEKLKAAQARASASSIEVNGTTYNFKKDSQTSWCFVTQAEYDKAFTGLKDSLGFILVESGDTKTITLPKREVFFKPSTGEANVFNTESLPNITGKFMGGYTSNSSDIAGAFTKLQDSGSVGGGSFRITTSYEFDASKVSKAYKTDAKVNPDFTTGYLYYKVGNTIVNSDQIDLGNLTKEIQSLQTSKANTDLSNVSSNIDFVVESGSSGNKWYRKWKSGWLEQGGVESLSEGVITLMKPYANTDYIILKTYKNDAGTSGAIIKNVSVYEVTTTSFKTRNGGTISACSWKTEGQGA